MERLGLSAVLRRLSAPLRSFSAAESSTAGRKADVDLQRCVNAEFFRMLVHAPYQHIDAQKDGVIGYADFAAYFSWVASEEELRFAFDVLRHGGDRDYITYGTLQSFQQKYDAELVANRKPGRVGCPDYLEYFTLLLGIRTSCRRLDFMTLEGAAIPPRPSWLLQQLEEEWIGKEILRLHWRYVTQPVPERAEERRFPDWNGGFSVRDSGHEGFTLQDFLRCPEARQAGLCEAEVLALRLYTGPGYELLNRSLRANSQRFPVTQFCIDSAVGKLAKLGVHRPLLRGMKKQMHPRWVRRYDLYRGVGEKRLALSDPAFVSCTTDLEVAVGSNFGGPVMFVLHTLDCKGQQGSFLSVGAELDWVSQYPGEAEVLLPSNAIFIPHLRCKHARDHGLDVPPTKHVYEFDVFYPWDFEHNCPLVTDDYLSVANQLLLLQHEAELLRWQTCQDKHPLHYEEALRNAPPPPSRTLSPAHRKDRLDQLATRRKSTAPRSSSHSPSSRASATPTGGGHKWADVAVPSPVRCASEVGSCFSEDFSCIFIGARPDPVFDLGRWHPAPNLHPTCTGSSVSLQSHDGRSFKATATPAGLRLEPDSALSDPDLETLPSPVRTVSSFQHYLALTVDLPIDPLEPPDHLIRAGTDTRRLKKLKLYTLKDVALLEKGIGVKPVANDGLEALAEVIGSIGVAAAAAPGPPGPAGAATGATGAAGAPGTTGAAGASGTTGAAGASGTTGAAGAAGASGTTGAAGASGTTGATGAAGAAGHAFGAFPDTPSLHCHFDKSAWDMGEMMFYLTGIALAIGLPTGLVGGLCTVVNLLAIMASIITVVIAAPLATLLHSGRPHTPAVMLTHTPTVTGTPTPTATGRPTPTPTLTLTASMPTTRTGTASQTSSLTATSSRSPTASRTASASHTHTCSGTATRSPSPTPSSAPPRAVSPSPTPTATATRTTSVSGTGSWTGSLTSSRTHTCTSTATTPSSLSTTLTSTATPTVSATATRSSSPTDTRTSSATPTRTSTCVPTATNSPSSSHTLTATGTWSASCTPTPTRTLSSTPSRTPTSTETATRSPSCSTTLTGSATRSLSATVTTSRSPTTTLTRSATLSRTQTSTATATATSSRTPTTSSTSTQSRTTSPTRSATSTASRTSSRTASETGTSTTTESQSATPTDTRTHTGSPTQTHTSTGTSSPSTSPTLMGTATQSVTATVTGSCSPTPTPTVSFTPSQTQTSTATATATTPPTPTASSTSTQSRTTSPTQSATSTVSRTSSGTASETGTGTATESQSATPTDTRTHTGSPTQTHTSTATSSPTPSATLTDSATRTFSLTATTTQTHSPSYSSTQTSTITATATTSPTPTTSSTSTQSRTTSPTQSATSTASSTSSGTTSETDTSTATESQSVTPTDTRTHTGSPTKTHTTTATATSSRTRTASSTSMQSRTTSPTQSATSTASRTSSGTASVTETSTATESQSVTPTDTRTHTGSPTKTHTTTATATSSRTRTTSSTSTQSPTTSPTQSATSTASRTSSGTASKSGTGTASESQSATPTDTRTHTGSPTQTHTSTGTVSPTPSLTLTGTVTQTGSTTATGSRTGSPTRSHTHTFTGTATSSATATATTTASATRTQSQTPSLTVVPVICSLDLGTSYVMTWTTQTPFSVGTIEILLKLQNVVGYGVPVAGNSNSGWTVYLSASNAQIVSNAAVVWTAAYPGGVVVADGKWHTVTMTGSVMTIDGVLVGTSANGYGAQAYPDIMSTPVYANRVPSGYTPAVTSGGNYEVARVWMSAWNSSVHLYQTLTFSSSAFVTTSSEPFTWTANPSATISCAKYASRKFAIQEAAPHHQMLPSLASSLAFSDDLPASDWVEEAGTDYGGDPDLGPAVPATPPTLCRQRCAQQPLCGGVVVGPSGACRLRAAMDRPQVSAGSTAFRRTAVLRGDVAAPFRLTPAMALTSPDGEHRARVTSHGLLVVERLWAGAWTVTWSAGDPVAGPFSMRSPPHLAMQWDGDVVLYDANGARRWAAGTAGRGNVTVAVVGSQLTVRSHGVVVWASPF